MRTYMNMHVRAHKRMHGRRAAHVALGSIDVGGHTQRVAKLYTTQCIECSMVLLIELCRAYLAHSAIELSLQWRYRLGARGESAS